MCLRMCMACFGRSPAAPGWPLHTNVGPEQGMCWRLYTNVCMACFGRSPAARQAAEHGGQGAAGGGGGALGTLRARKCRARAGRGGGMCAWPVQGGSLPPLLSTAVRGLRGGAGEPSAPCARASVGPEQGVVAACVRGQPGAAPCQSGGQGAAGGGEGKATRAC